MQGKSIIRFYISTYRGLLELHDDGLDPFCILMRAALHFGEGQVAGDAEVGPDNLQKFSMAEY